MADFPSILAGYDPAMRRGEASNSPMTESQRPWGRRGEPDDGHREKPRLVRLVWYA
jgi:hypothetical protein